MPPVPLPLLVPPAPLPLVVPPVPLPDPVVFASVPPEPAPAAEPALSRIGLVVVPDVALPPVPMPPLPDAVDAPPAASSADSVCVSSWPLPDNPCACWKRRTARSVCGPQMPSTGPGSKPRWASDCCTWRTVALSCMPASAEPPREAPALRDPLREPLVMLPLPADDEADIPERPLSRSIDVLPLRDVPALPMLPLPGDAPMLLPVVPLAEPLFIAPLPVEPEFIDPLPVEPLFIGAPPVDPLLAVAVLVDALPEAERDVVPDVVPLLAVRERSDAPCCAPSWPTTPPTPAPTAAPTGPATAAPTTAPVAAPVAVPFSWRSMLFQLAQPANSAATASATVLRIILVEFVILVSKALNAVRPVSGKGGARGTDLAALAENPVNVASAPRPGSKTRERSRVGHRRRSHTGRTDKRRGARRACRRLPRCARSGFASRMRIP